MCLTLSLFIKEFKEAKYLYENDNLNESVEILKYLSSNGLPEATRFLAFIFSDEEYSFKNLERASEFYLNSLNQYSKLSEEGNHIASLQLAKIYEFGDQIDINMKKSIFYYELSATQGNPEAMYKLACSYNYGWFNKLISKSDYLYFLKLSAKEGYFEAVNELKGISQEWTIR